MTEVTLDDYDWQPPTDAEMKVIQARRERSDKISSLMGEYLLKGYKMLSSVCDICETILLETPNGDKYCIACRELDEDAVKDNPVFQLQNSQSQQQEKDSRERSDAISKLMGDYLLKGYKMLGSTCTKCDTILLQDRSKKDFCIGCEVLEVRRDISEENSTSEIPASLTPVIPIEELPRPTIIKTATQQPKSEVSNTVNVLRLKIEWATEQLELSQTVDYNIQLCYLIKSAAEAISSLQTMEQNDR